MFFSIEREAFFLLNWWAFHYLGLSERKCSFRESKNRFVIFNTDVIQVLPTNNKLEAMLCFTQVSTWQWMLRKLEGNYGTRVWTSNVGHLMIEFVLKAPVVVRIARELDAFESKWQKSDGIWPILLAKEFDSISIQLSVSLTIHLFTNAGIIRSSLNKVVNVLVIKRSCPIFSRIENQ